MICLWIEFRLLNFHDAPVTGTLKDLELKASGNFRHPALDGSFTVMNSRVAGELVGDLRDPVSH